MSVVNNTLSEINDSIVFTMDFPVDGINSLTGFTEGVEGETVDRFFNREFRYAIDAINFTDWIDLNNTNLQSIPIETTDFFQAEFRYTRAGTDNTGLLTFNWVRLNYTTTLECRDHPYFDKSIFKYFFECPEEEDIRTWCISVLRKLYFPGIVPLTLIRNENRNLNKEDKDYIAFWKTVACLFSIIVNYGRSFEKLNTDQRLMSRYLENQDIIVSKDQTIEDLQYLMNNLYDEIRQRGTVNIASKKDISNGKYVDGELLRLIEYDDRCDELIFDITRLGWILDIHSPMYRGIAQDHAIKGYETSNVLSLSNYPLINGDKVSIIDESGEKIIKITGVADNTKAGIGFVDFANPTLNEKGFLFNIDPFLDYEISFMVRGDAPFTVGAYGYNLALVSTNPDTINPLNNTNFAIVKQKVPIEGDWFWVRVILFNNNQVSSLSSEVRNTSLGLGNNLRLPSSLCKAAFEITLDRTTGSNQDPTVSDHSIGIKAGNSRVITVDDIKQSYQDIEGDPYYAIRITGLTNFNTAELLLNGVSIQPIDLPLEVTIEDIALGKLVFSEQGPLSNDYTASIVFTPLDNQPIQSTVNDILYLKNIKFKLLNRDYGICPVNGIHLAEGWLKNRSGKDNRVIDSVIRNSLIPYNVSSYNNYL